ncbi:hypothetical protein LZG04_36265 [Saccharothrix sp. S26]|uniref:hypothetical protein n=1 Tax=Saccharothrix sp. S26 TaxID=2907215 RepID=UPI001F47D069|nr:hypothetical protein [Saccharothrix sp. S26]MCE7000231.1 hypothetical protein [Saccharothrix sp. S26]
MRWLTGGTFTILACTVAVGCAAVPGQPTGQRAGEVRSAEPTTSEHTGHETPGRPGDGSGTRPEPSQPQIPSPRVPPGSANPPGVPGSPIKYDTTQLLGTGAEETKSTIEERIRGNRGCDRDLCGVTVTIAPRAGGNCVDEISPGAPPDGGPASVQPGGTVRIFRGRPCFGETTGETTTSSEGTTPVHPTSATTPEPTTGTTGGGR